VRGKRIILLQANPGVTVSSHRKVVYVTFEETAGPSWVRKNAYTHVVRGLRPLDEKVSASFPASKIGVPRISLILKDIQESLSSSIASPRVIYIN
jgi:hypothetical protein